jgi:hypothetical protein
MASPIYIPTNSVPGFPFLHILVTCYHLSFITVMVTGVKWYLLMVLICSSLKTSDGEYRSMHLLAICIHLPGINSLSGPLPILKSDFYLSYRSSSHIWGIIPSSYIWLSIFSPHATPSFLLCALHSCLHRSCLVWYSSACLLLLLLPILLASIQKRYWQDQCQGDFPVLSYKTFISIYTVFSVGFV